jgi:hypothetical protein
MPVLGRKLANMQSVMHLGNASSQKKVSKYAESAERKSMNGEDQGMTKYAA